MGPFFPREFFFLVGLRPRPNLPRPWAGPAFTTSIFVCWVVWLVVSYFISLTCVLLSWFLLWFSLIIYYPKRNSWDLLPLYCVLFLLVNHLWKTHGSLKCIIFDIAYGEIQDLLAWKDQNLWFHHLTMYFIDLCYYLEILKKFYLNLYYLRNW